MLAVTPLRSSTTGDRAGDVGGSTNLPTSDDFSVEFDFDFDFSELFAGFDDAEPLPSLDIDATDFPAPEASAAEAEMSGARHIQQEEREKETVLTNYEEVLRCETKEETSEASEMSSPSRAPEKEKERGRKPSAGQAKRSNGKRKKYRSQRKHTMARDAETMSSNQRRQAYITYLPLTMGFTPNASPHPHHHHHHQYMQHFKPLHVWGHPTMNQSLVHMWPKHIVPIGSSPTLPWVAPHTIQPPSLPPHGSPWSLHFASGTMTQGSPYFSQPPSTLRFPALPVPGIPPHPMCRTDGAIPAAAPPTPPPCEGTGWLHQLDAHPSKESIDAVLGDVLAQPWLPLPLGLKPPSSESVMVELQKQGISNVPPSN
uniref:Putative transcription factor GLK1 isoform X2 n=1 Tax=Cymbidium ensifolium TaxID=78740 RepID=A0A5J6NE82_CYMEN|nr:putative transcription factor GLK1 isoform X2 [Cymbidium ensifolium]